MAVADPEKVKRSIQDKFKAAGYNADDLVDSENLRGVFEKIGGLSTEDTCRLFDAAGTFNNGPMKHAAFLDWLFSSMAGSVAEDPTTNSSKIERAQTQGALRSCDNLRDNHIATWQNQGEGLVPELSVNSVLNPMADIWPKMNFVNPDELVSGLILKNDSKAHTRRQEIKNGVVRANASKFIFWQPSLVKAAMVTCGGLCPGLNSIIRELTLTLWHNYGVRDIVGMTGGYNGLSAPSDHPSIRLDPDVVKEIHMKGGSILKAGRGGCDPEKIVSNLKELGINMLFVIGGDGTQSAGHQLYLEAQKRNVSVSIVGVPKSIDNDILFIDKTFGFESAVAAASEIVRNAWVEATSCDKACSIVKLMGRDAGFIAASTALASTIVDVVLIPEVKFELDDVHNFVWEVIQRKGFCVMVVAEGAGQEYVATGQVDSSGHTVYGDIGVFMRDSVNSFLKPRGGRSFYIDPSYIIRSVPPSPTDHIYCGRLAADAVHTAMRGYTGVCVGALHNVVCIFPSDLIASGKRKIKVYDSNWQSCVRETGMPMSLAGFK